MSKIAVWLTALLLLVYLVFTSGLFYWLSECEVTNSLVTPFSWALSDRERGLTPIATKGDIDCVHWLIDNEDKNSVTMGDSNGSYLLRGWVVPPVAAIDFVESNPKSTYGTLYIFLTDWNVRYGKYTYCTNVGLRTHYPYHIDVAKNGEILIYGFGDPTNKKPPLSVKVVYKSGNSVIYQKVDNMGVK